MQKGLKFAKRSDIVIILALIVLSVVGIIAFNKLFADVPAMAEIYYKSELIMTVELKEQQEEKTFSLEQDNDVVIKLHSDGAISFLESDCPDKICINSGKLSMVGQRAACLPNGIIIKIVPKDGHSGDDIDIVI